VPEYPRSIRAQKSVQTDANVEERKRYPMVKARSSAATIMMGRLE